MYKIIQSDNDTEIAYRQIEGAGTGVIFIGGFMSDMTGTKATFLEELCQQYGRPFIRFDHYGHGISSGKLEEGTIGHWLRDSVFVIDKLTQGPQVLVGSSMGGWLMILAALQRKDRIQGLVGVGSAPDFVKDFDRLTPEQQAVFIRDGMVTIPSQFGDSPYKVTQKLVEEGMQHCILGKTIPLQCKVRLMHGLADTDVPWQKSIELSECLLSSDVVVALIKDGQHRLNDESHLKILGDFVREVANF